MPATRPQRPASGAALVLPRVLDETVQRALDRISLVIEQIRGKLNLFSSDRAGIVPASGDDEDAVLHADGTWSAIASSASAYFDTILNPAQITGTINDWNVGTLGRVTLVRCSADASRTVRGLVGGDDGKVVYLLNVGATGGNTPNYQHEDGAATAGNRFHNAGGASVSGGSSGCVQYYYDGAAGVGVWRNIGDTR